MVDDRYTVQKRVGSGAYGHVFSAKDSMSGKKVAIKWIHKAFEDVIDAKRVLREIKILSKCRHSEQLSLLLINLISSFTEFLEHENIVELLDIQRPEDYTTYDDVYIITHLMEADLHHLIYSK